MCQMDSTPLSLACLVSVPSNVLFGSAGATGGVAAVEGVSNDGSTTVSILTCSDLKQTFIKSADVSSVCTLCLLFVYTSVFRPQSGPVWLYTGFSYHPSTLCHTKRSTRHITYSCTNTHTPSCTHIHTSLTEINSSSNLEGV